jgi:hypothetical protein
MEISRLLTPDAAAVTTERYGIILVSPVSKTGRVSGGLERDFAQTV